MRIAWFTPFHVRSAIGEFSRHVTTVLARQADVDLWVAEEADVELWTSDEAPLLETELPLVRYSPASDKLAELQGYDSIVYNLGNYLSYHGPVHRVSKDHPGVVILHDRALHHMFSEMWLMESEPDPPRYIETMGAYYGPEGAEIARASLEGRRPPVWESEEEVLLYPLYEEGIVNAMGVVTHSEGQARDVRRKWLGPVAALHLPCYMDILERVSGARSDPDGGRLRLLTMGHLNPNKQVHRVIEMLAANPDVAERVEYRVIGSDGGFTAYTTALQRAVADNDALNVELVGWLSDRELEREMERADVFINLRHPNIEGGSASLMKQLAYGRPVLCFDSGCFGELSEDALVRVAPGDFGTAAAALRELTRDPELRARVGARARALAESYSEERYVEGLLALISESQSAAPGLRLLSAVALELGHMQVDARSSIFTEIAEDFARVLDL
jgi:glycosyltransferase involved in cell wall biosynthesis